MAQEQEPFQQRTRSGRVVKPKGYLDYTPDFKNVKYDSSNINVGTELSDSEILGMVFTQILEKYNNGIDTMGQVFSQFYLHEGLKKFGDAGDEAALKELKQLHQRDCFKPIYASELSELERKNALDTIVLIEENRDGRVKGRAVADGQKQRGIVPKEEAASYRRTLTAVSSHRPALNLPPRSPRCRRHHLQPADARRINMGLHVKSGRQPHPDQQQFHS
jgi:hypothetical protein